MIRNYSLKKVHLNRYIEILFKKILSKKRTITLAPFANSFPSKRSLLYDNKTKRLWAQREAWHHPRVTWEYEKSEEKGKGEDEKALMEMREKKRTTAENWFSSVYWKWICVWRCLTLEYYSNEPSEHSQIWFRMVRVCYSEFEKVRRQSIWLSIQAMNRFHDDATMTWKVMCQ